jgi:hypothetical protein
MKGIHANEKANHYGSRGHQSYVVKFWYMGVWARSLSNKCEMLCYFSPHN